MQYNTIEKWIVPTQCSRYRGVVNLQGFHWVTYNTIPGRGNFKKIASDLMLGVVFFRVPRFLQRLQYGRRSEEKWASKLYTYSMVTNRLNIPYIVFCIHDAVRVLLLCYKISGLDFNKLVFNMDKYDLPSVPVMTNLQLLHTVDIRHNTTNSRLKTTNVRPYQDNSKNTIRPS